MRWGPATYARVLCGLLIGVLLGGILCCVLIQDYSYKKTGIDLAEQFAFRFRCAVMISIATVTCTVIAYLLGRHAKFAVLGGIIGATIAGIGIYATSSAPTYVLVSRELFRVLFQEGIFWLCMRWGVYWSWNRSEATSI